MNTVTANIVQNSMSYTKAREAISCVLDILKDTAASMPDFTVNQASVASSVAKVVCGGSAVLIVGMITRSRYTLKVSKDEGVVLSPHGAKVA